MKKFLLSLTFLIATNVASQNNEPEDKILFFIDDVPIKQSTLVQYHTAKDLKNTGTVQQQQSQQMQSIQELINIYLISAEAEKLGLDNDYTVKQSVDLARRTILMKAMVDKYAAEITVTDKELDEAYALINKNAVEKADFKIRNIIVGEEKTALEIIAKLKAGKAFEQLEKKYSPEGFKESESSEWMNSSMVQPEIATAIQALNKTEYTRKPVKTQFGWHVIYLADKKQIAVPKLDEIKDQLRGLVKKKKLSDIINQLRSQASIKTSK